MDDYGLNIFVNVNQKDNSTKDKCNAMTSRRRMNFADLILLQPHTDRLWLARAADCRIGLAVADYDEALAYIREHG